MAPAAALSTTPTRMPSQGDTPKVPMATAAE